MKRINVSIKKDLHKEAKLNALKKDTTLKDWADDAFKLKLALNGDEKND
jgi:predicted HicB family RNase H-like nuclease